MLENINSYYIAQIVFSFIDSKKGYKLVQYNKRLINRLKINPLYFKILSGKYLVYKKNRKVREYDLLKEYLIFEGEYLNGKRNGKGIEYRPQKFEGNYLDEKEMEKEKNMINMVN